MRRMFRCCSPRSRAAPIGLSRTTPNISRRPWRGGPAFGSRRRLSFFVLSQTASPIHAAGRSRQADGRSPGPNWKSTSVRFARCRKSNGSKGATSQKGNRACWVSTVREPGTRQPVEKFGCGGLQCSERTQAAVPSGIGSDLPVHTPSTSEKAGNCRLKDRTKLPKKRRQIPKSLKQRVCARILSDL